MSCTEALLLYSVLFIDYFYDYTDYYTLDALVNYDPQICEYVISNNYYIYQKTYTKRYHLTGKMYKNSPDFDSWYRISIKLWLGIYFNYIIQDVTRLNSIL